MLVIILKPRLFPYGIFNSLDFADCIPMVLFNTFLCPVCIIKKTCVKPGGLMLLGSVFLARLRQEVPRLLCRQPSLLFIAWIREFMKCYKMVTIFIIPSLFLSFTSSKEKLPSSLHQLFDRPKVPLVKCLFSLQFSSVAQSCPTLCDPMNCSTPGLPVHHQLPEFTQTHIHQVSDAIQPSHPLSSPLLLPPIPPSIRVFSNELTLRMRWPKDWSFSFSTRGRLRSPS